MNAQQTQIKAAMVKINEAVALMTAIDWTPAQVQNMQLGEHVFQFTTKIDNALGRLSTVYDACKDKAPTGLIA